jgi:hypothetical protein
MNQRPVSPCTQCPSHSCLLTQLSIWIRLSSRLFRLWLFSNSVHCSLYRLGMHHPQKTNCCSATDIMYCQACPLMPCLAMDALYCWMFVCWNMFTYSSPRNGTVCHNMKTPTRTTNLKTKGLYSGAPLGKIRSYFIFLFKCICLYSFPDACFFKDRIFFSASFLRIRDMIFIGESWRFRTDINRNWIIMMLLGFCSNCSSTSPETHSSDEILEQNNNFLQVFGTLFYLSCRISLRNVFYLFIWEINVSLSRNRC